MYLGCLPQIFFKTFLCAVGYRPLLPWNENSILADERKLQSLDCTATDFITRCRRNDERLAGLHRREWQLTTRNEMVSISCVSIWNMNGNLSQASCAFNRKNIYLCAYQCEFNELEKMILRGYPSDDYPYARNSVM